jgi:hypothetical protein
MKIQGLEQKITQSITRSLDLSKVNRQQLGEIKLLWSKGREQEEIITQKDNQIAQLTKTIEASKMLFQNRIEIIDNLNLN